MRLIVKLRINCILAGCGGVGGPNERLLRRAKKGVNWAEAV